MRKMKRRGFTLIELLAVIVILAVIALIATPIIVGVINDAEKNTFEDTVYGIVKAGELHYGQEVMKDSDYVGETLFLEKDELSYSGEKVKGTVLIENDGKVTVAVYDNKNRWCAIKEYGSEKASIQKYEEGKCNVSSVYPVMQAWKYNSTTDFHNSAYKSKIKTAEFVGNKNIPTEAIETWDVSESKDGSVMAWITDAGEGFYHLYIGGDRRVSANQDSSYLFYGFTNIENIDATFLYTGNAININRMFYNCEKLVNLAISNFDTSNVTDMGDMFYGCHSLKKIDVSHFNTSNVTNMYDMFAACYVLSSLDVSGFNTSKVERFGNMFWSCYQLWNIDVSGFDTSNATNMAYMFYKCQRFTTLDVSHFDTSKVTDMSYMFYDCSNLTELDVSGFDTSNVTNMKYMFSTCEDLIKLDVSHFNTSNVTKMNDMFYRCQRLTTLNVSHFDTSNVTDMSNMFRSCKNLQEIYFGAFEYTNLENTSLMFTGLSDTVKIIVKNADTQNYILGLPETDRPATWDTSNVIIG